MLHDPKVQMEHHTYEDVNDWWRGKGVCINGSWRKYYKAVAASEAKKKLGNSSENPEKSENPEEKSEESDDSDKASEPSAKASLP